MLTQVDHIDMRVNDLEATVETLKKWAYRKNAVLQHRALP
mgnify:CR=1 FL=1